MMYRAVKKGQCADDFFPFFLALNRAAFEWRVKKHDEMPEEQVGASVLYLRQASEAAPLHIVGHLL